MGDAANEMGDNLPIVDLGTGRTATAISLGNGHTCAMLDNGFVKCWGYNANGRLGQGNTNSIGKNANEMGDNLPAIDL
jgi:alpha-tubulin suppressor-like RCC1 family protein